MQVFCGLIGYGKLGGLSRHFREPRARPIYAIP
jgi:hypothetical protein